MSPILDHLDLPPDAFGDLREGPPESGGWRGGAQAGRAQPGRAQPGLARALVEVLLVIGLCVLLPALPAFLLGPFGQDETSAVAGTSLDLQTIAWTLLLQSTLFVSVGLLLRWRQGLGSPAEVAGVVEVAGERLKLDVPGQLVLGALGGIAALIGSMMLGLLLSGLGAEPAEQGWIMDFARSGGLWPMVLVVLASGVVPVGEELLFRGYAFERLLRAGGPTVAYCVSTCLFAAVHVNPSAILIYLYLGLVMAWLYHHSHGLLAPITAHAINNGVAFALLLAQT